MEKNEIIKGFWQEVKSDRKLLRQKNKKDALGQHTSDIRNAFVNYIDRLQSAKEITSDLANEITLP
jgi:hypothetical protein